MSHELDSDETTVLVTYPNRRDAEIALDRLQDEDVSAFVTADDAGGMHPHLQQTHGVKLIVLRDKADRAGQILEAAGLTPDAPGRPADDAVADVGAEETGGVPTRDPEQVLEEERGVSGKGVVFLVASIVLILALLISSLL